VGGSLAGQQAEELSGRGVGGEGPGGGDSRGVGNEARLTPVGRLDEHRQGTLMADQTIAETIRRLRLER
jgi:hypothetical protein